MMEKSTSVEMSAMGATEPEVSDTQNHNGKKQRIRDSSCRAATPIGYAASTKCWRGHYPLRPVNLTAHALALSRRRN